MIFYHENVSAEFVSLRQAIVRIARAESLTPKRAAKMLLHNLQTKDDWQKLVAHEYDQVDSLKAMDGMSEIIDTLFFCVALPDRSEYVNDPRLDLYGFTRSDCGALIDFDAETQWSCKLYGRPCFNINEITCILLGIPPDEENDWQWLSGLSIAMTYEVVNSEEFELVAFDGRDGYYSHDSIAAWCHKKTCKDGIYGANRWPLRPLPIKVLAEIVDLEMEPHLEALSNQVTMMATELAGTFDTTEHVPRLIEAKLKAERLEQELANITAERDKLRRELQDLTDDLINAKREAAQSQTDLQQAKIDLLQGKSRASALKLVGGMALAVYKIPIKSGRLTGLTELRNDLERVGVAVSEDVIRNHLKAAAELI